MKRITGLLLVVLAVAGVLWADATLSINGAGATFPNPIYSKWFDEYHKKFSTIQINYQSQGSGAGIKQVTEGTVDFGATDGPMTEEQLKAYQDKHGSGILHFPTVLGAVVLTYNIAGVDAALNFTPDAFAGIFLGKITKWNDPAIADVNKGVNLPAVDIVVVQTKVGKGTSVNWPVGLGGKGNEGVTGTVKNTPNSIGYVELIYAESNKIPYGNVKNAAGAFVKASLATVSAAAAGAAKDMPDDFRVSITNAPGKASYPISTFTWLLIPEKIPDAAKRDALKGFVKWALADGQGYAESLLYAKLPKEVVAKELKAIDKIQ